MRAYDHMLPRTRPVACGAHMCMHISCGYTARTAACTILHCMHVSCVYLTGESAGASPYQPRASDTDALDRMYTRCECAPTMLLSCGLHTRYVVIK